MHGGLTNTWPLQLIINWFPLISNHGSCFIKRCYEYEEADSRERGSKVKEKARLHPATCPMAGAFIVSHFSVAVRSEGTRSCICACTSASIVPPSHCSRPTEELDVKEPWKYGSFFHTSGRPNFPPQSRIDHLHQGRFSIKLIDRHLGPGLTDVSTLSNPITFNRFTVPVPSCG